MIFMTVGTQLTFDRMVQTVDGWCESRKTNAVFGQISDPGPKGYRPAYFEWRDFIAPDEFNRRYEEADLIIAHAGMGSIISALTMAKPIVIMPRKAVLGEHRNDHQLATAEKFADRSGVYVAWNETELPGLLDRLIENPPSANGEAASAFADPQLIGTVRDFIFSDRKAG
ncbi:MAG: hypothetical protein EP348_10750 [Alphaproteobacteria bacterium]|nr:MAG: hypothetical protein EP348_10750 [Alphaproteobacteria bacterium]